MLYLLNDYLQDPFLKQMYHEIRKAGPIRSISVDITHRCNLQCQGCYFLVEKMYKNKAPTNEAEFDAFIEREKVRGTNFITVIGGEPSLMLERLKKLNMNFKTTVVTNGLLRIPFNSFKNLSIAVSVWGDHETDKRLRGNNKIDVFEKGLENYKNDPRVAWYYTTTSGNACEIESVVEQCVSNGNYVIPNFYGDISRIGGDLDHCYGFDQVRHEFYRMIKRYPDKIFCTSYIIEVITSGQLYDEKWGYDVCGSFSFDNEKNKERVKNGKPFNRHFRAYNPDLITTRRCCVGEDRDCTNCFDLWAHFSWIISNMKRHLGSIKEFTNWLTTVYIFYTLNRFINLEEGIKQLPEIQRRLSL